MPANLVTIKTTQQFHNAIRLIAAGRNLKQYEVMDVLIEVVNKADGALVDELFAKKCSSK